MEALFGKILVAPTHTGTAKIRVDPPFELELTGQHGAGAFLNLLRWLVVAVQRCIEHSLELAYIVKGA